MARIAGIDIPREKRLEISLTYIFGIGRPTAQKLCADLGLDPDTKVSALTDDEVAPIRAYVDENLKIEGDLRRERPAGHQAQDRDRLPPGRPSPSRSARCAASAPTPTPGPARAPSAPLPTRRRL